jgi:hypothetical protein
MIYCIHTRQFTATLLYPAALVSPQGLIWMIFPIFSFSIFFLSVSGVPGLFASVYILKLGTNAAVTSLKNAEIQYINVPELF